MVTERTYRIGELIPYIDWTYFFHAWKVPADSAEADGLKAEAVEVLQSADDGLHVTGRIGLFDAGSNGDDIIVADDAGGKTVIPCLRQQHAVSIGPNLCLADFVRPLEQGMALDKVGVFATTAACDADWLHTADDYKRMMVQTLCDRLAEAAACRLHEEVRKDIWGYAPDERLTIDDILHERNQGIRPAVGYPSLPDQSINFLLAPLIGMGEMGISLTENGAMQPQASVSGLMIAHPESRYFAVGQIDDTQLGDYAARRGLPIQRITQFIKAYNR